MRLKAKSFFTVILLVVTMFTLSACNGLTPNPTGEEKAVPVYQGMVVSETLSTLSANDSISPNIMRLKNIGVTRNLNTNPIDQDDPFGTLDDGTISEFITTEFPVTQTEVADYYSEINKDIFITVKLSNPDNFVILSFTLNGVFYQSYQFQDGSDSENLILKVNTGTVSGVKEYTIDAIKYIDGTDIKDAIFAGERTITVGLKHNSEPSVLVSDEVVNATSILLTVNLSDSQSLSTLNKIVLYDGESLVQIYDLSLGENNIVFDKLNINTLYQYAVISVYDLIDGNNSRLSLLEKKALYTDDIVSIDNVVPTQTSIGFGITVTDVDQVGAVSAIELYQGETLVESLTDLSVREFTGLLSNNEYTIKVTYTYDLNDGVGSQTLAINQAATTIAKATPTVVIDNVVPTQTSIGFGITVTDVDQVGAVSAIELYQGQTLVESLTDLSVREFTGLLSNNEYTIKVTYTYDLNDGVGAQTLTINQAATTLAKATPTVVIDNVVSTQTSIGFGITVADADQVGAVSAIELYQVETLVEALTDLSVREFTELLSSNEYTIKVTYTYDLNGGVGSQTLTINQAATTLAKATPTVVIDNVVSTQTSIGFGITVTDVDQVGAVSAIELYQGQTLVESLTDLSVREFTGLLSNNEYTIKVTYTYDLNDGEGAQTLTINQAATTLAKATPTVVIVNLVPTQTSIGFGITVTDVDQVGSVSAIELYKGETLVEALTDLSVRVFTGLLSNNEYTIKVTYTYDLNDGLGARTITKSLVISTNPQDISITSVTVLNSSDIFVNDSIELMITYSNLDKILVDAFIVNGSITSISYLIGTTKAVIILDGFDASGIKNLNIEGYIYNYANEVNIDFQYELFVAGKINVMSMSNSFYNIVANDILNDITIVIDNPDLLDIFEVSVRISGIKYTYNNDNFSYDPLTGVIVIPYEGSTDYTEDYSGIPHIYVILDNIIYGSDPSHIITHIPNSVVFTAFTRLKSGIIYPINNVTDFGNIDNGYIYELNSDLDFSNTSWAARDFYGAIFGNNYKISNVTITSSQRAYHFGIFSVISGVFKDITIENVDLLNFAGTNDYVGSGLFAAYARNAHITNIAIIGENSITTTGGESNYSGCLFAGIEQSFVTKLVVDGVCNITTSNAKNVYIGGITSRYWGRLFDSNQLKGEVNVVISNISSEVYIGGIIGGENGGDTRYNIFSGLMNITVNNIPAQNSSNFGIGGILGKAGNNVIDNLFSGTLNVTFNSKVPYDSIGGITGAFGNIGKGNLFVGNINIAGSVQYIDYINISTKSIEGYYVADFGTIKVNGYLVSPSTRYNKVGFEDLNNENFYLNELKWDNNIWNLSNLDVKNNIFPTLK